MGKPELDREADIRKQHKEFSREGYDGHNHHPGITTMQDLENRRKRRIWNCRMRENVNTWNNRNSQISYFKK